MKEDYENGVRDFGFDNDIYGHDTVKEALRVAQHDKCCFCERKPEIGDVEHFRPKSAWQQQSGGRLIKPGYYWLAYDWNNLFFSCEKCNRSYKKNLFPLSDETKRANNHSEDLSLEEPLFIHPADENPEDFIEFKGISPRSINGNLRGRITIQKTGIDRPFLDEERLTLHKTMKSLYDLISVFENNIDTLGNEAPQILSSAKQELEDAQKENAAFSLMIICAIRDRFRF